ncbi:hypothetical protein Lal_00027284 [Lupinus albus]|nr:hypothetical protein Lal_00027284 [Lupinus albus]
MKLHPREDIKISLPRYVHIAGVVGIVHYLPRCVQRPYTAEILNTRNRRRMRWRRRRSRRGVVLVRKCPVKVKIRYLEITLIGEDNNGEDGDDDDGKEETKSRH